MPIESNASNKQVNVGKMRIKGGGGVAMAVSHGSPSSGTCHTDLSVENKKHKRNYPKPEPRCFEQPRCGWEGMNKRKKTARQLQASHNCKTMWQWLKSACAT